MNGTTQSQFSAYYLARFNMAAALMTVIPLLICCYLIAARFFSLWILVGLNGLYFCIAILIAVVGLLIGRKVITNVVKQLIILEERATAMAHQAEAAAAAEEARAVELDEAYQNLQKTQAMLVHAEKLGAVGELASGVAHEVKNPLAIIMQGVNFLERDVDRTKPEQGEVLGMMKEAVIRADKVVRGLLDFSRPGELKLRSCALNPVIDEAVDLVDKQLTLQNIQMTKDFATEMPEVLADPDQMKQVLINLILNAVQAMPRGGRRHGVEPTGADRGPTAEDAADFRSRIVLTAFGSVLMDIARNRRAKRKVGQPEPPPSARRPGRR